MKEIIPAILPRDFSEIEEKTSLVKGVARTVQIDICDGVFVPNVTWPFNGENEIFEKFMNEEEGLPFWKDLNYEFDLMINWRDVEDIEDWVQLGASRLILHAESKGDLQNILKNIKDRVEAGLALNMDTPIDKIAEFEKEISFVQLMGIDRVGFQGQSFNPEVIECVKKAKEKYPHLEISVDGGVSLENAEALIQAGVGRLVVGSALFNTENFKFTFGQFEKLIK